jgi:hypothetical protein
MMTFSQVATATLDELTDELAAACWDSTQTSVLDAREAVARLLNEMSDLRLYDSNTSELITSEVTDEQAIESAQSVEGHILVDGRKCYVSE